MASVFFPLIPYRTKDEPDTVRWREVEFRFGIHAARDIERLSGCSHDTLYKRGQYIEAIVYQVWGGLRKSDKTITVDKATDMVEAYRENGGDIMALYEALTKAWDLNGVYGPRRTVETPSEAQEGEGSADPPQEPATTT